MQDQFNTLLSFIPVLIQDILKSYNNLSKKCHVKSDGSPVTELDLYVNKLITNKLQELTPTLKVVSEENNQSATKLDPFWLIDPIDGTYELFEDSNEFACNIAFIQNGVPIFGVVVVPFANSFYFAFKGKGAFVNNGGKVYPLNVINEPVDRLTIVVSRNVDLRLFKQQLPSLTMPYELVFCGSAIKFCLLAENKADLYIRLGNTGIWDTAAPEIILKESGGILTDLNGRDLIYEQELLNPSFVALSSRVKGLHHKILPCG